MKASPFPASITLIIGFSILLTGCTFPFLINANLAKNLTLSWWAGLSSAELLYFVLLYQEKKASYSEKKSGILPSILLMSLSTKQREEQLKAAIGTLQPFPVTATLLFIIFCCAPFIGFSPLSFSIIPALILINSGLFFSNRNKKIILACLFTACGALILTYIFYSSISIKSGLYILICGIAGALKEKPLTIKS